MDQSPPSRHLVHPSLEPALDSLPEFDLAAGDLAQVRAGMVEARVAAAAAASAGTSPAGGVAPTEQIVPGPGGRDVRVLIWRSPGASGALPAVLHIHGGGFVMGSPDMSAADHAAFVAQTPCVLVAVEYALAPEATHPAAVEDCYAALRWMAEGAGELSIDPTRIGVSGVSAGGGLAAALTLLARDRGEIGLAFQHLIYPMLDDRTGSVGEDHPFAGHYVWPATNNQFGWRALLGQEPGGPAVSPYAAAARAENLAGLPPTFISVGALDLFAEENLDYARRLMRAGVPVELHVYPGAFHGFHLVREAEITRQALRDEEAALVRFLGG